MKIKKFFEKHYASIPLTIASFELMNSEIIGLGIGHIASYHVGIVVVIAVAISAYVIGRLIEKNVSTQDGKSKEEVHEDV
ncbi:hypothetical protein [Sessilibacter corallicola]|uniref:Uncharacterized protein n=1 Tax=Sessilibacter corallicola TaxID=2904075 RepID=A0ABQ0AF90_9GAMM